MTLHSLRFYREYCQRLSEEFFEEQKNLTGFFEDFLKNNSDAYKRSNKKGHITASGFVLSTDKTSLLMTYHAKLRKWLQLGGHADGHTVPHEVAYKECEEESGLTSLVFFPLDSEDELPCIFDLDRHIIPARKDEQEHFHYDIRYLLLADKEEPFTITEESLDLKWIPLNEIPFYSQEFSIMRPIKKIQHLLDQVNSEAHGYAG